MGTQHWSLCPGAGGTSVGDTTLVFSQGQIGLGWGHTIGVFTKGQVSEVKLGWEHNILVFAQSQVGLGWGHNIGVLVKVRAI